MNRGEYHGDITTFNYRGKIRVSPNVGASTGTTFDEKLDTLGHDTGTGLPNSKKYYNGGVGIYYLKPGTRYQGQVVLMNNKNEWRASTWGTPFFTPNVANTPDANPILNDPTAVNDATATFTASYQAGDSNHVGSISAHPSVVEVEYSTDDTNWSPAPLSSTPTIDEETKKVTFTLNNLTIKTRYYVRYKVKNQSDIWSRYSGSRSFDTKGLTPIISPPIFVQTTATPTTINMLAGTYTGDLATTANHGHIITESYNSGGSTDRTTRVSNLAHNSILNTYSASQVSGLKPGTRYRGWVGFRDYGTTGTNGTYRYAERTDAYGNPHYFYTTNKIANLSTPVKGTPTTSNNATATFTASYEAGGDHTAQVAAHPEEVKVYLSTDGLSYNPITTTSSGPKLEADNDINPNPSGGGTVTFKLKGLQENTHYYVKYAVVNAGGTSPESTVYEFDTLSRTDGLYITEAPYPFDFGTVDYSGSELSHPLVNTSGNALIDFENVNMNTRWILAAQLSELEVEHENLTLPGSKIRFNRSLQKTTDGTNWTSADPNKFDTTIGISGAPIELVSNGGSVPLYKATDIPYGKSRFQGVIPRNTVKLIIPANTGVKGKTYKGKITWTFNDTP